MFQKFYFSSPMVCEYIKLKMYWAGNVQKAKKHLIQEENKKLDNDG